MFGNFYIVESTRKNINYQNWYSTLEDVGEDDMIVFSKEYEIYHKFKDLNNIYKVISTEKKIYFKHTRLTRLLQKVPFLKKYFLGKALLKVWMVVLPVNDRVKFTRKTFLGSGKQVEIPKNAKNLFFRSDKKNQFILLRE